MTKAIVFHPFQKVWTPRTPDSGYDSLGSAPLTAVVFAPQIQEGIGTKERMQPGLYMRLLESAGSSEGAGYGIKFLSGTYMPPSS